MLMHPCYHILFIVLIGFDPKFKIISKTLENGFGKSNKKKEKTSFPLPPSFRPNRPSRPAAIPIEPARARFLSFFLAGPAQIGRATTAALSSFPLRLTA
jgi:hypothetical protein